jgi:hypothetical protein
MKKLLLISCLFLFKVTNAQTIVIGSGANTSATNDIGNPIFSDVTNIGFSKSVQLLKASQQTALPAFATITAIGYQKNSTATLASGRTATVKVYLKNTTFGTISTLKNFESWIQEASLVYSTTSYSNANMPSAAGLVSFSCNNFIYTGGSLEVYIDFVINGSPSNATTGGFTWAYDTVADSQCAGTSSTNIINSNLFLNLKAYRSFKTTITYNAPVGCSFALPGNTIASNNTPCYGDSVNLSLSNYQTGTTYQWYNSNGIIPGATAGIYTTPSLTDADSYYCRVTCSGSTTQNSNPITITPKQRVTNFPFLETFDDNSPTALCWKSIEPSNSWIRSNLLDIYNLYPAASSKFAFDYNTSSNTIYTSPIFVLPATAPNYKQLVYKYNINKGLSVQVSVNGGAFTTMYQHDSSNSNFSTGYNKPWSTNSIGLNAYDGQNIQIRFKGTLNVTEFYAIDEIKIEDIPVPCSSQPFLPTVAVESATSVKVFFAALPSTNYVIEYGLSGFTPGLENMPGAGGTIINASSSPVTITGLQNGQTYTLYVRQKCPATLAGNFVYSINSSPVTFNTCNATDVPYSQNFETATVPGVPACTSVINSSTGNVWATQTNTIFGASSKTLRYNFNNADANTWFFTQGINLQSGVNYVLKYKYNSTGGGYIERMKVAYGTASTELAMTNIVATYPTITSSATQNATITVTPSANGVYYFGFNCYSTVVDGDQLYVDDISLVTEASLTTADNNIENNLKIYPNPTTGILNLELQEEDAVSVFDISGKQLLIQTASKSSVLDLSGFANGIYLMKLTNNNQEVKTVKVNKN